MTASEAGRRAGAHAGRSDATRPGGPVIVTDEQAIRERGQLAWIGYYRQQGWMDEREAFLTAFVWGYRKSATREHNGAIIA